MAAEKTGADFTDVVLGLVLSLSRDCAQYLLPVGKVSKPLQDQGL